MPEQSNTGNSYGKTSYLTLKFCCRQQRTILDDAYFTAPFKVMKPFLSEKAARFMILSASAGIMAGDCQKINICLQKDTAVELTSQSYEKIHKMKAGRAVRDTQITLERDTLLFYMPQPVIPFAGSAFISRTDIRLADDTSRLFYSEILSCGRAACRERFLYRKYASSVKVYAGDDICYFENACYSPARQSLEGFGFYEGYTHLATLLIFNFTDSDRQLKRIRQLIEDSAEIDGGVSCLADNQLCIKALACSGEILINFTEAVKNLTET